MYKSVDLVYPDESSLEEKLLEERNKYNHIFEIIEENMGDMILGGYRAAQKLNRDPVTSDSYFYELYSKKPFEDAKTLANAIFDNSPDKDLVMFTSVITEIINNSLSISVNDRQIVRIHHISKLMFEKVIIPVSTVGIFTNNKINILSVDLQLISVYQKLMSPQNASEWPTLLKLEEKLKRSFKNHFSSQLIEKYGGKQRNIFPGSKIKEFLEDKDRVLVGPNAADIIMQNNLSSNIYYIATSRNLLSEFEELEDLLGVKLEKNIDKTGIPFDSRIFRLTVQHKKATVVVFYNTAEFNLVPYNLGRNLYPDIERNLRNVKVGSPFAVLLHTFMDLWRIQSVVNKKFISDEKGLAIIKALVNYINKLYEHLCKVQKKIEEHEFVDLLFPRNFIGQYYDFNIYKRIENLGKFSPPPYMPLNRSDE